MAKVAKKLFFDIENIGRVNAMPGSTFNPGGFDRNDVIADTGPVGNDEVPVAPSIEFELPVDGIVGLNDLRNITDVNVTVQDDNGEVWVVSGCFVRTPPTKKDGKISVSMGGLRADLVS